MVTFQTLGYIAEALVFGYVGITSVYSFKHQEFSWQFIVAEFFIVIIGRTAAIFLSYYVFACCPCGSKQNYLTPAQVMFACYAAYIRGAIAFGLS